MLESGATGLSLGYQDVGSGRGAISNINNSGTTNNLLSLGFGAITAGVPANPVMTLNQSGNVGIGTTTRWIQQQIQHSEPTEPSQAEMLG
jgi:hypothetical protein